MKKYVKSINIFIFSFIFLIMIVGVASADSTIIENQVWDLEIGDEIYYKMEAFILEFNESEYVNDHPSFEYFWKHNGESYCIFFYDNFV